LAAAEKCGSHGFLFILRARAEGVDTEAMPIFSHLMFRAVHWAARRGLREEGSFSSDCEKSWKPGRTGIRGETYAYWYLAAARVHIRRPELHSARD